MMNNLKSRNILIAVGVIVLAIAALVIVGSLLQILAPLAITAVIAFILGRLSVNFNLLQAVRSGFSGAAKAAEPNPTTVQKAESLLEKPVPQAKPKATAPAPEQEQPLKNPQLLDPNFEVKTPEQIEAEAKQREQEALKHTASGDVNAALEERKRRLLGNK